jgi:hypothetical protein
LHPKHVFAISPAHIANSVRKEATMRGIRPVRLAFLLLLSAGCPFLTGCFSGWVYPSVSVVPPVAFTPASEEVRAFRVDVKDDLYAMDVGEHDCYELSEITGADMYLPQVKLALDHGWFMFGVALSYGQHTQHTLKVRLYRRGYDTVEIDSWNLSKSIYWSPACTLDKWEASIDDLVSTWETKDEWCREHYRKEHGMWKPLAPHDPVVFDALAPGSTSKAHRDALLFAANEYDQLRAEASTKGDSDIVERATSKAAKLRGLAKE